MSTRITNYATIPTELPELPAELPNRVPERFHNAKKLDPGLQQVVDRLTDSCRSANKELKSLRSFGILTADDLRGIIVMSDSELSILNNLLTGDVIARLESIEDRLDAGGL